MCFVFLDYSWIQKLIELSNILTINPQKIVKSNKCYYMFYCKISLFCQSQLYLIMLHILSKLSLDFVIVHLLKSFNGITYFEDLISSEHHNIYSAIKAF